MDMRQHIQETIDRLKAEREQFVNEFNARPFVVDANRQLAGRNAAIQVLEELLETAEKPVNGKVEADELAEVLKG
jgi:hypothetical protein